MDPSVMGSLSRIRRSPLLGRHRDDSHPAAFGLSEKPQICTLLLRFTRELSVLPAVLADLSDRYGLFPLMRFGKNQIAQR